MLNPEAILNGIPGTFPAQEFRSIPFGSATTIIPADFNNDGFIDIVLGDEVAGTFIYFNDKNGSFKDPIAFGEKGVPYSIAIGDLINDKKLDIVVGYVQSKSTAYFNMGNGEKYTAVKFGDGKGSVYGLSLGDINKDGFLDIGVACSDASNVLFINGRVK